jgi:hypothetical protein
MSRLSAIGVRRLRTLYDLGEPVPLTPITVLIGRNSAGKSTFARLLPLLRQSAERKKRGPILWFDDDLVDFGTLSQAVTRGESDLELVLKLDDLDDKRKVARPAYWGDAQIPNPLQIKNAVVSMTLASEADSGATYAKELKVEIVGSTILIQMKSAIEIESISIDSESIPWRREDVRIRLEQGSLLPRIRFLDRRKIENRDLWLLARSPWRMAVGDYIRQHVHQNTSRGTTNSIAARIPVASVQEVLDAIESIDGPPSWHSVRAVARTSPAFIKQIISKLLLANLDAILERLDEALSEAARGVRYLKPLRATAERYYRRVDLAVSEIDPEGRNLPMFLDSLSPLQLSNFRVWLKENLDIDVEPRREGAQVVLLAQAPNDSGKSNVADMGFGISQVLPIAAQLWASSNFVRLGFEPTSFVVIEQPELHLHPAFQAKDLCTTPHFSGEAQQMFVCHARGGR